MLQKIKKISLKKIKTKEGDIIKYLDKGKKYFNKFGEIYFSKINKGYIKGWNLHKKTKCYITVPYGSVTFVLKDLKMIKSKRFEINTVLKIFSICKGRFNISRLHGQKLFYCFYS